MVWGAIAFYVRVKNAPRSRKTFAEQMRCLFLIEQIPRIEKKLGTFSVKDPLKSKSLTRKRKKEKKAGKPLLYSGDNIVQFYSLFFFLFLNNCNNSSLKNLEVVQIQGVFCLVYIFFLCFSLILCCCDL